MTSLLASFQTLSRLVGAIAALAFSSLALAAPTPPTGSHWRLSNIATLSTIDPTLTDLLVDSEGNLSGVAGCNRYRQPLTDEGYGEIAVTRKACPEERMRQEEAFLDMLRQTADWQVDDEGRLQLKDEAGAVLAVMLEPIVPSYHFDCGGKRVSFDVIRRGEILLTHGEATVMLSKTRSASGSRYENESGSVVFWGKGSEGRFTRDGETLDCQQVPGRQDQ
ncbi:MAG: META domain-containing protein [Halothiobacillaceae bacterium]|nr:META domain-containing protein [Halothiobacillaceae bacterium]HER34763.1 META domain-containing protein [Halothiobacillaceae bacterium]